MKKILAPLAILFLIPAFAAPIKNVKCSDIMALKEKVVPEYLAVIDGYDKSGKTEEIDVGGILAEAKAVNNQCPKNKSANIKTITRYIRGGEGIGFTMNPIKADCKEFVAMREELQPVAIFWVAGHNKSGNLKNGEVDEEFLSRPIATLVADCKANPSASFYEKTKAWFKKNL